MNIDPKNPVVKLCIAGIAAEMRGRMTDAIAQYLQAWDERSCDLEACIAAHYVARIQDTPEKMLHWNLVALRHAERINDNSVQDFYPSLYLNVGKSYEDMGNRDEARRYYQFGEDKAHLLPDTELAITTRKGIANGLARVKK